MPSSNLIILGLTRWRMRLKLSAVELENLCRLLVACPSDRLESQIPPEIRHAAVRARQLLGNPLLDATQRDRLSWFHEVFRAWEESRWQKPPAILCTVALG
jgi:hypothetical protein